MTIVQGIGHSKGTCADNWCPCTEFTPTPQCYMAIVAAGVTSSHQNPRLLGPPCGAPRTHRYVPSPLPAPICCPCKGTFSTNFPKTPSMIAMMLSGGGGSNILESFSPVMVIITTPDTCAPTHHCLLKQSHVRSWHPDVLLVANFPTLQQRQDNFLPSLFHLVRKWKND